MDVQLLVVEDCTHEGAAAALLRRALDDVGLTVIPFETQVVSDVEQAAALLFVGSPTFLINGLDPFGEPGGAPALACRLYQTGEGLTGLPGLEPLRQALKQAAHVPSDNRN